jgi:hypothetical protein
VKSDKNIIIFTISHEGREYQMQTNGDQYESLMSLISDHLPVSGFGICYGGGCCGTCGVEIREDCSGERKFTLSCEIKIDDELANKRIVVLRE